MRKEKQLLLDEFKDKIEGANALVFTKYETLTPDLSADFRSQLREAGGAFSVVKKRVFLKACEASSIEVDPALLEGHIGIVFAEEDPIATTKAFINFSKDHDNLFEVLVGKFDGKVYARDDVIALSKLPSQDEMRAQFLGLLIAPMSQTLSTMESLLTSVMHCLENKSQQSSE